MNRREGWVALLVLGTALSTPTLLNARTKHPEAPKEVQKSSKQYDKEMRKQQKQSAKLAKKHTKQNKKRQQQTVSRTVV